jgi:hypothetical protein
MASFYIAQGADKTVNGSGDTEKSMFVYKWNVLHQNGLNRIDDASHYLWDLGRHTKTNKYKGDAVETTWDDLTRSEKLGLIELHLKQVEKDLATSYNSTSQIDAARATAAAENATDYEDAED